MLRMLVRSTDWIAHRWSVAQPRVVLAETNTFQRRTYHTTHELYFDQLYHAHRS